MTSSKFSKKRSPVVPAISYPQELPIVARRADIIKAIRRHRVVVITGETGSGKTTQIPKMCIEAGRGTSGLIGCTEPRRVAAITVAHRIAEELGEEVGRSVGYQIRFEDRSARHNLIKIMTDGILLSDAQNDPYLRRYDTIIVDEAHERSLNIDFILGILRALLSKRRDLKVVITSATIDTEKFSRVFNAPVIEVSGRLYPVEVRYQPLDFMLEESGDITYVDSAVNAVNNIMKGRRDGDVLVFMPTERDIRDTCQIIDAKWGDEAVVLPLFARLSWREQRRVFQNQSRKKIVVATNVAETSITIPGIRYVIDTGLARISQYNPRSRTTSLPIKAVSQSSADQRKGRCGRVQHGVCIRLFDEADYASRPLFTEPEILRSNLAEVVLRMLSLNLGYISTFPFIDPPHPKNVRDGIDTLKELGAIRTVENNGEPEDGRRYTLTDRGKIMARLPIDPRISRMVVEAARQGCVNEILVIASALSIQDSRERPVEFEKEADEKHAAFADPSSDFMTLLRIWNKYHSLARSGASKGQLRRFCRDNYLSARRMNDWVDVCEQLESILQDHGWKMGRTRDGDLKNAKDLYDGIHKSILSGFLSNIAVRKEKNNYAAAKGRDAMLFPGSTLWGKGGGWIVAAEMIETSRLFARMAANVDAAWLEELGGSLCRTTYSEPHWGRERGEVAAYEQVTLFGLTIVERRRVSYGRINPDESSEIFIRSALIEGDVRRPLPFMLHNLKMREKVSAMEDKIRRRNLLAGEDQILLFYKKRLPGIYDMRTLQKLIRDKGGDAFLRMKEEDILARTPDVDELAPYPDHVTLDSHSFTCHYRYEPGHPEDGVTVKVPVHMLSTIPPEATDWMVPGLTREKIAVLLKGLPKEYRKKLQPLSQTCDIIMDEVREAAQPLVSVLGRFIERRFGVNIPSSLWNTDALENRLDPRFSITDDKGRELAAGRDIRSLQRDAVGRAQSDAFDRAKRIWEKTRLTTWDFGDLPYAVSLQGISGYAYPALEPNEGFANLRLYENKQEAIKSHRGGVSVLYRNYFKEELKYLKKAIALPPDMKKWADPIGGAKAMESIILEKLVSDLFSKDIRSQDDFFSYTREVKGRILPAGQDILNVLRPCLRSYYETLQALRRLAAANRMNRPALAYLDYLAEELRGLMPKDFLLRYGTDRLARIMTYLKALAIRAERGIAHVDRALAKTEEANIFSDSLRDMISNKSTASEEKLRLIEEYRWMIEEYKVSLFAQELKTPSPVSRKRLENKRQEIERII